MSIKRYGIYWVQLNPVLGAEIAKTRPAVIISDDAMNQYLQTVVVCPITSKLHPRWRSRLEINCAGRRSEVAIDQIRTISKLRIGDRIDQVNETTAQAIRSRITEMYATG